MADPIEKLRKPREKAVRAASQASPRRGGPEVERTLNRHQGLPFVDRILNPHRYPVRKNSDGGYSTHRMSTSGGPHPTDPQLDEPPFAYPTLQYIKGEWVESTGADAARAALERDNIIYFDTLDEARTFAEGAWKPVQK